MVVQRKGGNESTERGSVHDDCCNVSGMCVYVHACAATPLLLVQAMTQHGITAKLKNVEVIHMHTQGDAEYAQPHCKGRYLSTLSVGSAFEC